MLGVPMAVLALIMIPLGFALSWWTVRRLDRAAAAEAPGWGRSPDPAGGPLAAPVRPGPGGPGSRAAG